jgi:hypothetical protein
LQRFDWLDWIGGKSGVFFGDWKFWGTFDGTWRKNIEDLHMNTIGKESSKTWIPIFIEFLVTWKQVFIPFLWEFSEYTKLDMNTPEYIWIPEYTWIQ